MAGKRDYYEVLGVDKNATDVTIAHEISARMLLVLSSLKICVPFKAHLLNQILYPSFSETILLNLFGYLESGVK